MWGIKKQARGQLNGFQALSLSPTFHLIVLMEVLLGRVCLWSDDTTLHTHLCLSWKYNMPP